MMAVTKARSFAALVLALSVAALAATAHAQDTPTPVSSCAATNAIGWAYDGRVCGGSTYDNCTPGAIYECQGGVRDPASNCVLAQVCATGCLTGRNSTPVTANTPNPVANDACFAGTRPLTLSTSNTVGGTDVTVTVTLSENQSTPNGPIVNLRGGGTLVPHPFCAVPFRLAPGSTTAPVSVSFGLPTAVVTTTDTAHLDVLLSYNDTGGFARALVSIPWSITVEAGGTEPPPPPVESFTLSPSVIGPGQLSMVDVVLASFAPARGISVSMTSDNPSVAAILENDQPFVQGGCRTGGGAAKVQAASFVERDTIVDISASTGAPGEVPVTNPLRVTATELELSKVSLSPSSVLAGASSTGTVTMTRAAPAGGAEVLLTSSDPSAVVPASVTVPEGRTTATFTVTTRSSAAAYVSATIGGSYEGGFDASAQLEVWPAGTAQALQGVTIDPAIVLGPDPATGTVSLRYAPSAATTVTLSSSNSVASVPASVSVSTASHRASFPITTKEVSAAISATISAVSAGVTQTALITVRPRTTPPASAVLSSFSVSPTSVVGGNSAIGTVMLESPAPAGGVPVNLSSQLPGVASVPASVTVAASAGSATFTITTSPPSTTTSVSLSASLNGTTRFATLAVTPPPAPPTITSTAPTTATVNQAYSYQAVASGSAPITWSLVTAPAGMTIAASTGLVAWTPAAAGSFPVQIRATNSGGSATQAYSITVTTAAGGAPGFQSPTASAADSGGDGNGFETSPTNAHGDDTLSATDNNSGSGTSTSCTSSQKDRHRYYNYGFSVPGGAIINGIEVRLDARADSTSGTPRVCVQLSWDGGTSWTVAKATGTLGTSPASYTLGSATDTWGRTWSAANLANTSFRVRVINVSSSTSRDFFLDWVGVRVHTAAAGPASLSAVSLSPATVVGGNASTGTVTLTAIAPTGGAVVSLTSSNTAAATVPASVTVAAGATSASFTAATQAVGASTSVTISGTYAGVTRNATLTVNSIATADTVAIQRAEYDDRDEQLRVEATSTSATATLQVFVTSTNQLIGTLTNNGGGRYSRTFNWPSNPQNVTVRSSLGGSASRTVTLN